MGVDIGYIREMEGCNHWLCKRDGWMDVGTGYVREMGSCRNWLFKRDG